MEEEKILDKIQKLLRLGESPNINESAAALAKAQELMEKYKISLAMLGALQDKTIEEEIKDFRSDPLYEGTQKQKNRSQWHIRLASVLAHANDCRIYLMGPKIFIVGRPSDEATVRYLFFFCDMEILRLSLQYAGKGKGWLNNYKLGAVQAIEDKLREAKKNVREETIKEHGAAGAAAIVKVDNRSVSVVKWMEENLNLRAGKGFGNSSYNQEARAQGYKDGKSINVGGSSQKLSGGGHKKLSQ